MLGGSWAREDGKGNGKLRIRCVKREERGLEVQENE